MATKKWLGLAVVVTVIGIAYVLTKVREDPTKAAEVYEGVKESAKESPEKAAALYDAARDKLQRGNGSSEGAEAEKQIVAS